MKHSATLVACFAFASFIAQAQNDPFWNPDANGDNLIGFADLASLLSVYNSEIGIDSAITCDFDGTTLELFTIHLFDQTIILDSVFFEFELSGVANEYTLGCPDPIQVQWNYSSSGMAAGPDSVLLTQNGMELVCSRGFENGVVASFGFYVWRYNVNSPWQIEGSMGAFINNDTILGGVGEWLVEGTNIPSQNDNLIWDSLGIRRDTINPNNFIRVLPFWHYAE